MDLAGFGWGFFELICCCCCWKVCLLVDLLLLVVVGMVGLVDDDWSLIRAGDLYTTRSRARGLECGQRVVQFDVELNQLESLKLLLLTVKTNTHEEKEKAREGEASILEGKAFFSDEAL